MSFIAWNSDVQSSSRASLTGDRACVKVKVRSNFLGRGDRFAIELGHSRD